MRLPSYDTYGLVNIDEAGNRVLPVDSWDDALRLVCGNACKEESGYLFNPEGAHWIRKQMLRDVTVWSVDMVYRALIGEGEHQIVGRVEEPGPDSTTADRQRYKRSEEAVAFTKAWAERLDYPLKSIIEDCTEAKFHGHKLCEAEVGELTVQGRAFKGRTFIAPTDYSPKPQTVYRFKVTSSNKVVGVLPRNAQDDQALVPIANLLVVSMASENRDPRGTGTAEAIYETVQRRRRSFRNQDKSSDQTGGGFPVVEEEYPPVDTNGNVQLYDQQIPTGKNKEDGTPETISRQSLTSRVMATAATGKAVSLLPGQTARLLQGDGAAIYNDILDRSDRDVAKAYLGNAQIVNEAKRDSQAASGKAENVGETIRDHDRGIICLAIEAEFKKWLRVNFGGKYDDVVPRYDIVTEEGSDLAVILSAMVNPGFAALPVEIKNELAARGGFKQVFTEEDEIDEAAEIDSADQAATEEEVTQFIASFSDDDRTTFASRIQITNGAAQRRLSGGRGIVKSANRQFRSLVKRLADGKITSDEFASRFAYTISVGHERALNLGWQHGLGANAVSSAAEEYLNDVVLRESDFAKELANDLASGEKSFAQANLAAQRYAQRMGGTANEAFRLASIGQEVTFAWELGGAEEHCADCPALAALSPYTPETLFQVPRDFQTPCRGNCVCRLVRSDGREGFGRVTF